MKRNILWLISGMILIVCLGAVQSGRIEQKPIDKYTSSTVTWAAAVSTAQTVTLSNLNGLIGRVDLVGTIDTTNSITFTISAVDQNGATVIPAIASIPDYPATSENAYDTSSPPFEPIIVANDTLTFTITPSGVPGASTAGAYIIVRMK